MMGFDYSDFTEAMANNPAINIALPQGGAILLLAALQSIEHRWQWETPSDGQWDDLKAMLDIVTEALMIDIGETVMLTGSVVAFAGDPGSDWLECDGQSYERDAANQALYDFLDAAFIDDVDNFTVPDLREKTVVGVKDGGSHMYEMGVSSGTSTHTLSVSQIPPHGHGYIYVGGSSSSGWWLAPSGAIEILNQPNVSDETGGGGSHNNMQPYQSLSYWIKL